jgi:hypothetical protein
MRYGCNLGSYRISRFPNDQSVRSASVRTIQTSSFPTPAPACKSSQILRKKAFSVSAVPPETQKNYVLGVVDIQISFVWINQLVGFV